MSGRTHVVAVDLSRGAELAFNYANTSFPKEDKFVILHGRPSLFKLPGNVGSGENAEWEEYNQILSKFKEQCAKSSRTCTFDTITYKNFTELGQHVNNAAHKNKAHDIIVGSRGLSGLKSTMMGSVSNTILQHSSLPVTVVKETSESQ